MKKMKIIFVNFGLGGYAGDSVSMITIIKGLEDKGHEVLLVTTDGDGYYNNQKRSEMYAPIRKKLLENNGKIIKIDNISVYPVHCMSNRFGMYCPSATKEAKKIIKKYDIVYIINWYYHLGMVFAKTCHELDIPFIVGPMASLEKNAQEIKKSRKSLLDKLYTNKMIKHVTGLHCVGKRERNSLLELGIDSKKIFLINNGIKKIVKPVNDDGIFKKMKIDRQHDEYLISVGQINEKKGLDILIHSFSQVIKDNKIKLVIVGTGERKYVHKIKELVRKLGLDDVVIFSGFVTEEEKNQLLSNAKLFVSASRSDVHPIAAIEALSVGLPVVITEESDFPEIDTFHAGKTTKSNEISISNSINDLLREQEKLSIYSENAKKLVEEVFLLKNQIEKYESMFSKVISNK